MTSHEGVTRISRKIKVISAKESSIESCIKKGSKEGNKGILKSTRCDVMWVNGQSSLMDMWYVILMFHFAGMVHIYIFGWMASWFCILEECIISSAERLDKFNRGAARTPCYEFGSRRLSHESWRDIVRENIPITMLERFQRHPTLQHPIIQLKHTEGIEPNEGMRMSQELPPEKLVEMYDHFSLLKNPQKTSSLWRTMKSKKKNCCDRDIYPSPIYSKVSERVAQKI